MRKTQLRRSNAGPSRPLPGTEAELKHQRRPRRRSTSGAAANGGPAGDRRFRPSCAARSAACELHGGVKLIALTFDLCEENGYVSGYDGRIVDLLARARDEGHVLRRRQMDGDAIRSARAQLIADPLFEIGAHGLGISICRSSNERDAQRGNRADRGSLCACQGGAGRRANVSSARRAPKPEERLTLLRFPYGRCSQKALAAAADAGQARDPMGRGERRSRPEQFRPRPSPIPSWPARIPAPSSWRMPMAGATTRQRRSPRAAEAEGAEATAS